MNTNIDYYYILELIPKDILESTEDYMSKRKKHLLNVTPKEVKLAFRKLSKLHHPDKTKGDDTHFKTLTEAYKVLSSETLRKEYDSKSEYGLEYDTKTELYNFEFSNTVKRSDSIDKKFDKYKKDIIDILLVLDEFQDYVIYDRHITCKTCSGNGFDPDKVDIFECDICQGDGEDRVGKKCSFCNGSGKNYMGFDKCKTCDGSKLVLKKEKIKLKLKDFKDNKCILKYLGNSSSKDIGKVGSLYIKIKK